MALYRLKTPISEEEIRKLKVGDTLFISGTVVTSRDYAHRRALEFVKQGKALPINLEGLAVYHCGPVMSKQDGVWRAIAAGPTTSTRMEAYEEDFIRNFNPRVIIGKGGMGLKTTEAMVKYGVVYGALTGGTAVLTAKAIKEVTAVFWMDLGMPEAMWVLGVRDFGPLIVAIDSSGKNLFRDVAEKVEAIISSIYSKLGL